MNSLRLMPALPFIAVFILGVVGCFYCGIIPQAVSIPFVFASLALAYFLRNNAALRIYPLLFATFFVAVMLTQREKQLQGIGFSGNRHEIRWSGSESDIVLKARVLRTMFLDNLHEQGLDGDEYAIVAAMAFGDKSALNADLRDDYSVTGAGHLLALSGMHLGILYMMLSFLLVSRRSRVVGNALVLTAIWTYVVLVGMPTSIMRAALMLTIYSICTIDGRRKMSVNALCVTALVMLMWNPLQLWNVSFQMSFMSLVAIFIFTTPIYNIIKRDWLFEHPQLRKLWSMIAVSCAAQIGVGPLVAFYFGRFSCYFLLTNLIAIPLVSLLLYSVLMCCLTWYIAPLKICFITLINGLSHCLNYVISWLSSLPGASIEKISINWVQLMLIYGMIAVAALLVQRLYSTLK